MTEATSFGTSSRIERGIRPVRASMAVPFIFPSVAVDNRHLVDGVMPLRIGLASRLVAQTSTALINNLMQARMDAARQAGQRVIHLELELDCRVGLWETSAMPYLVDAGRRAAEARLPEILSMATNRAQRSAA